MSFVLQSFYKRNVKFILTYTVHVRTCTCVCTCKNMYMHISVFDKLKWHTIGPKSFLFGTAQFSLWASGAVNYDYIALTLC